MFAYQNSKNSSISLKKKLNKVMKFLLLSLVALTVSACKFSSSYSSATQRFEITGETIFIPVEEDSKK